MTANARPLSQPAAPPATADLHENFFALFGGPIAWLIQLCGGYALATEPCFVNGMRLPSAPAGAQWTSAAMILLMVGAVVVALASLLVSWRAFKRARDATHGEPHHLTKTRVGRARFLALWGGVLGGSFAVITAVTAVAFVTMPRCAG